MWEQNSTKNNPKSTFEQNNRPLKTLPRNLKSGPENHRQKLRMVSQNPCRKFKIGLSKHSGRKNFLHNITLTQLCSSSIVLSNSYITHLQNAASHTSFTKKLSNELVDLSVPDKHFLNILVQNNKISNLQTTVKQSNHFYIVF